MIFLALGTLATGFTAYQLYKWSMTSGRIPPVRSATGNISSEFGWRYSPIDGVRRHHDGIDIAGVRNQPVVAVENGVITTSKFSSSAGEYIVLKGDSGVSYEYMYLAGRFVPAGSRVIQGQPLGQVGATGNVTGAHLHFEVRVPNGTSRGRAVDPRWYFSEFWSGA